MGNLPAFNLSLDHTALALSLFQDGAAVNLSLIILHSATVMRGRAVARPSCVYTVDAAGVIVAADGNIDDNGEVCRFSFLFLEFSLEKSISNIDFDFTANFLTLFLTESIGKRWSNEADSTTVDR